VLASAEFDGVVRTVLDNNPGMPRDTAARIVSEALKFVVAGARFPGLALAPSRVVDEGWHALILHTRLYATLCGRHGGFVHHTPGYDPTHFDPSILDRTRFAIARAGYETDPALWRSPADRTVGVAASCQHAPECAILPMPTPRDPRG
jgi:hypothetical protein